MSRNVHAAEVVAIVPRASAIVEYVLRTEAPLRFLPGQFISVRVGHDGDGNPILRSYSIASSPGPEVRELSLILKQLPGGPGCDFFHALLPGAQVDFTGPMGFFVLDFSHPGDVVFGVTGVGITPVLPMLEALLARGGETGRVRLLWGNRQADELFWLQELEALTRRAPRFSFELFLSGDAPGWSGRRGRIGEPLVELLPSLQQPVFYLVGNGAMIKETKAALLARGVDKKRQIRNEAFFG